MSVEILRTSATEKQQNANIIHYYITYWFAAYRLSYGYVEYGRRNARYQAGWLREWITNPMPQNVSSGTSSSTHSQRIPHFYKTQKFITVFTTANHTALSWAT
jgi:hypothetical protein